MQRRVGTLGDHRPLPLQSRKDGSVPVNGKLYQTIVDGSCVYGAILADENL